MQYQNDFIIINKNDIIFIKIFKYNLENEDLKDYSQLFIKYI